MSTELAIEIEGGEDEEQLAPETTPEAPAGPTASSEDDTQPEPPKTPPLTAEQQETFNEEIGKKVAKQREAERATEEANRRAQELQERLDKLEAPARPEILPIPDPYDDGYDGKMKAYEASIAAAAGYDSDQRHQQQLQESYNNQISQQRQEAFDGRVKTYAEKAEKLNISKDELQVAGNNVAQYGINPEVAQHILDDERGPELTVYLSANPMELEKIGGMTPVQAGIYLETQVKPKSQRAAPALTTAPTETVGGAGMPEGDRGPKGVTYE